MWTGLWTGLLDWIVDWTAGLDYWTGLLTGGLDYWTGLLDWIVDWTGGLDYWTGLWTGLLDLTAGLDCWSGLLFGFLFHITSTQSDVQIWLPALCSYKLIPIHAPECRATWTDVYHDFMVCTQWDQATCKKSTKSTDEDYFINISPCISSFQ